MNYDELFWPRDPERWRGAAWIWTALGALNICIGAYTLWPYRPSMWPVAVCGVGVVIAIAGMWRIVWAHERDKKRLEAGK